MNKKIFLIFIILSLEFFYWSAFSFGEIIYLKSGERVKGKIIEDAGEYIKVDFQGIILTYRKNEIENIEKKKKVFERGAFKPVEDVISDQEIRDYLKKMEINCSQRNIDFFNKTLANGFKAITFIGDKRKELSREMYIKNLKNFWERISDYSCKIEIVNIMIVGSRAIVETQSMENITFLNGRSTSDSSIQKMTLERIDGIIKQRFIEVEI